MTPPVAKTPHVPVSWGEAVDKLTILEIKQERLTDRRALANVARERAALAAVVEGLLAGDDLLVRLKHQLREINQRLWDVEAGIRAKEAVQQFDQEFVELARSVYRNNDERAAIKKQINLRTGSEIVEEKSY